MPILGTIASSKLTAVDGDYESIATVTVGGGGASDIVFSSIPSTYAHLQIRGIGKTNRATYVDDLGIRLNGDSGATYSWHRLYGVGSGTPAQDAGVSVTFMNIGQIAGGTVTYSQGMGAFVIDILDYANTNKNKTIRCLAGYDDNGQGLLELGSGNWRNTNAITSISLLPVIGGTFSQYSSAALYGIKGA